MRSEIAKLTDYDDLLFIKSSFRPLQKYHRKRFTKGMTIKINY